MVLLIPWLKPQDMIANTAKKIRTLFLIYFLSPANCGKNFCKKNQYSVVSNEGMNKDCTLLNGLKKQVLCKNITPFMPAKTGGSY
jgi:hypothetical protein